MPDSGWVNPSWSQVIWTTENGTNCDANHAPWPIFGWHENEGGGPPDADITLDGVNDPNDSKYAATQVMGVGLVGPYGTVDDRRSIGLQLSSFNMNLPAGTVERIEFRIRGTDLQDLREEVPLFSKIGGCFIRMLRLETRERLNTEPSGQGNILDQHTAQTLPQDSSFHYVIDENTNNADVDFEVPGYSDYIGVGGLPDNFHGRMEFDDRVERLDGIYPQPTLGDRALPTSLFNGSPFAITIQIATNTNGDDTAQYPDAWTYSGAALLLDEVQIRVHYHEPAVIELAPETVSMRMVPHNTVEGSPHFADDIFAEIVTEQTEDGDVAWPDLTNAIDQNKNTYSVIDTLTPGQAANALRFRDFSAALDIAVPANADISWVRFRLGRKDTNNTSRRAVDDGVFVMFGDFPVGDDLSEPGSIGNDNYRIEERAPGQPFLRSDILSPGFGIFTKVRADSGNTGDTYLRHSYTTVDVKFEVFRAETEGEWDTASPVLGLLLEMPAGDVNFAEFGASPATMGVLYEIPAADPCVGTWDAFDPVALGSINELPAGVPCIGTWGAADPILTKGLEKFLEANVSGSWGVASPTLTYTIAGLIGDINGTWTVEQPENTQPEIVSDASPTNFLQRFRNYLPPWFGDEGNHPVIDAVLIMATDVALSAFEVIRFADFQVRLRTASGGWLDLWSFDFFRGRVPRFQKEVDASFRARIEREIFRDKNTRQALYDAMLDLTGHPPRLFEPQQPRDTGAYGGPLMAYNGVGYNTAQELVPVVGIGRYGEANAPHEGWIDVTLPDPVGIPRIGGYGVGPWGYGVAGGSAHGMWLSSETPIDGVDENVINETLRRVKPEGVILWVRLV